MGQLDDEQLLHIEEILQQYVKEHLSPSKENDNSFLFLEKGSLNLLLAYLLFMTRQTSPPLQQEAFDTSKLLVQLDDLIEDNKKEFEMLLDLFRSIP